MSRHALVVDDDPAVVSLIELALGLRGVSATALTNPELVLETARTLRPDVIVLDVMMPGLSGLELAARLREDEEVGETPLIILTCLSGPEDVWSGWQAGIDSYLTKPIDPDLLVMEIHRVVDATTDAGVDADAEAR
ncbi:MAG: response regulator [Nitriliruptorales bacterium]